MNNFGNVGIDTLRQLIDNINYGIIVSDNKGNFVLWNEKAEKIVGISGSIVDMEVWTKFFHVFDLEGRELCVENYPIMKGLNGQYTECERIMVKNHLIPQGVYISIDSFPIESVYGRLGAVVFTDITETILMENLIDELKVKIDHIKSLIENTIKK